MKQLYAEHRMQDLDRNNDGHLTFSEYIGIYKWEQCTPSTIECLSYVTEDFWPSSEREKGEEPEWLSKEKSNYESRYSIMHSIPWL